jgi:hypothetical protein
MDTSVDRSITHATLHLCVYWRGLQAAFTDILANGSILVGTAVVLINNFADKPTIRATMGCALIGVCCTRPSWTT